VRRFIVPLICLAVAGAAVAAALLTKTHHAKHVKSLPFVGFPTISGISWNSVADPGPITLEGQGTFWVALRGFALGRGGSFSLIGDNGVRQTVRLGNEPAIHFIGPVRLNGATNYFLTPNAGSKVASGPGDGRIFLSGYMLLPRPLAALAGPGFWPTDANFANGTYGSWLDTRGRVDLASAGRVPRVWLSFDLSSVDIQRTLTVTQGKKAFRVVAPERGASRHVTVGPFNLTGGAGQVIFQSPNPIVTARDARARTVRVDSLVASSTPPRQ
jgi:hypothetical protein